MSTLLVDNISSSSRRGKPSTLRRGDTLIVWSLEPSLNSCLVPSDALFAASSTLQRLCAKATTPITRQTATPDIDDPADVDAVAVSVTPSYPATEHSTAKSSIKHILLLQADAGGTQMPQLCSTPLDIDLSSAHTIMTNSASTSSSASPPRQVKTAKDAKIFPAWHEIFELLIRMILDKQSPLPDNRTASQSLPLIKRILEAAASINSVSYLELVFNVILLEYVRKKELWIAIAEAPKDWLEVGVTLKSRTVFDEAFKHLVGSWTPQSKQLLSTLDPTLVERMESRASEICLQRMQVERNLLLLSPTLPDKNENSQAQQITPPPMRHTTAFHVTSIWREWVRHHLAYLGAGETSTQFETDLCNHGDGTCLNAGGLFLMLSSQAYLTTDFVKSTFRYKVDTAIVRQTLSSLKTASAELVRDLTRSTLLSESKDKLEYLTCVEVTPADIPWLASNGDTDDNDMEVDED